MKKQIVIPSIEQIIRLTPAFPGKEAPVGFMQGAHDFSDRVHNGSRRPSGERFIEHDRAVSHQLGKLGLDPNTMAAGLIHDLPEETDKLFEVRTAEEEEMRHDVGRLVAELNKLNPFITLLEKKNDNPQQLEQLRRAILNSIDDDIRVLVLRMVDNLTDLRWAADLEAEDQRSMAQEAAEIYAPIANRLGIWSLKWELEDLSFRYLKPEQYAGLARQIAEKKDERDARLNRRKSELIAKLAEQNIRALVKGRSKHIYSIHSKMKRKRVPFSEIYDLSALRIIVQEDNVGQCYQALGLVHQMWHPIPEEFDDYIANPKPNGYRSLHTAIYDHEGHVLEVQIRTKAMDDDAERGVAAHWAYKEGSKPSGELVKRVKWLQQLLIDLRDEAPEDAPAGERMINVDDLNRRIYVFTPNDDLIELPEGGTPIDFAYRIHSSVGHRCRGARVNKRMVPLNHILEPGDRVEIITAKRGGPSRDWMNESAGYAKSGRTRSRVRQWFRDNERDENIVHGKGIIDAELRRIQHGKSVETGELVQFFNDESEDDFYARIGFGDISFSQITGAIGIILDRHRSQTLKVPDVVDEPIKPPKIEDAPKRKARTKTGLKIQGLEGLAYQMANCCMPIPPEPIKGYVTRARGVSIHRATCTQYQRMVLNEPDRLIEVSWGNEDANADSWQVPLIVKAYRRSDLTGDITKLISGRQITLVGSNAEFEPSGLVIMNMTVSVRKMTDLEWLTQKLRSMQGIIAVDWKRWN